MDKFIYDGLHGRLRLLIRNIGGYDIDYHIHKMAKEYNLNIDDIKEICNMTRDGEVISYYINSLREGFDIKYIRKIEEKRSIKISRN